VTVDVIVDDAQHEQPVDVDRWARFARDVLEAQGISGDAELTLRFVEAGEIETLNERYLGHTGPTDVLSFPIEDDPLAPSSQPISTEGALPILLGDVVICPAVAHRNAPDHDSTYDDEIALLIVHGILHLLGMDHESDGEAEAMEARERDLLAAHFRGGSGR
jgi:probable rRNA maturation factor